MKKQSAKRIMAVLLAFAIVAASVISVLPIFYR